MRKKEKEKTTDNQRRKSIFHQIVLPRAQTTNFIDEAERELAALNTETHIQVSIKVELLNSRGPALIWPPYHTPSAVVSLIRSFVEPYTCIGFYRRC